jgi:RNA polymerase sigma-70 factor (ECF subfamily)
MGMGLRRGRPAARREDASGAVTDHAQLEAIYREHYDFVWRNARRLGCAEDCVEDAVQEVFLVVERRLGEFEGRASVRTWLFAITYRVVQRLLRDRRRYRARIGQLGAQTEGERATLPHQRTDAQRTLIRLLSRLDEAKRVTFILIELEGMTSREVADLTHVPAGTVDSRLRSARLQLTKLIEQERDEEHLPRLAPSPQFEGSRQP